MDGWMREMKARVGEPGPGLKVRCIEELLVVGLFADDTMLLAQNEGMLQRIVEESDRVCRRQLRVNVGKIKITVTE